VNILNYYFEIEDGKSNLGCTGKAAAKGRFRGEVLCTPFKSKKPSQSKLSGVLQGGANDLGLEEANCPYDLYSLAALWSNVGPYQPFSSIPPPRW
jgi:hypothetical protein